MNMAKRGSRKKNEEEGSGITAGVAQWFRSPAVEPEVGSLIPCCTSLTGVGLDDP